MADNNAGTPPPAGAPPAAGTPPAGTPPAGALPAAGIPNFMEMIPEAYRDKTWVKENATSPENFFKWVDNANSALGKKGVIVPGDNATEAEINAFHEALGKPKTAEEYEIQPIEELKASKRDPEMDKAIKTLFHSVGIPKNMASKLSQGFEKIIFEKNKETMAKAAAEDKAFAEYNTKLFGDKKEAIVANAQKVLRDFVPPEALPAFEKLDGTALSMLVAITNNVFAKYGQEDNFKGAGGAGSGTGETYEELSAQQRKLMETPGFSDWRHKDFDSLQAKNKEIMTKMRILKP